MSLRSTNFYVEHFKLFKEKEGGGDYGFRQARKALLESILIEIKLQIQINFVDSNDPDKIVENVCQSITQVQRKWNAICYKIEDMNSNERRKDFHTLLKKYDKLFYTIWKEKDYSMDQISEDQIKESNAIKAIMEKSKGVMKVLAGRPVSEN